MYYNKKKLPNKADGTVRLGDFADVTAKEQQMKRFLAFLLGIIVGWVILIGGVVAAVFIVTPSTVGIENDQWVNDDGKRFDKMSFGDIITEGIKLTSSDNLTFAQIQSTYGIDVLGQIGLSGDEYESLRNTDIESIFSNPSEALSDVALADLLSGSLGESVKIPQAVINVWKTNRVSVGDLIDGNFQVLLNGVTLRKLTDISENSGSIEKIIADRDLGLLYAELKKADGNVANVLFANNSLGELMGYEQDVDGNWLSADGAALDATTAAVAKTKITALLDGNFKIEDAIGDLKVGELMGYTNNGNVWTDKNGTELTDAISKTIADVDVSRLLGGNFNVEDELSGLTVGEIMKYAKDTDGIWRDSYGNEVSKLTSVFADMRISELTSGTLNVNDKIDALYVGDLLNYSRDEENGVWVDGSGKNIENVVFNNIYNKKMSEMRNGLSIDEILSGVKIKEIITIKDSDPEIMKAIADKYVLTLGDELNYVYIGELQGYTRHEATLGSTYDTIVADQVVISGSTVLKKVNGKWYVAQVDCTDHSHTLATHTADCYEVVWYTDDTYANPVTGINDVICNTTLGNIDIDEIVSNIKQLAYTEVIDADTTTGALSLIDAGTKIVDLPDALSDAVNTATLSQLMNAGLLNLDEANKTKLNTLFGDAWKNMTFEEFIDAILDKIPA